MSNWLVEILHWHVSFPNSMYLHTFSYLYIIYIFNLRELILLMEEILHQLRLVVYRFFYRVLGTSYFINKFYSKPTSILHVVDLWGQVPRRSRDETWNQLWILLMVQKSQGQAPCMIFHLNPKKHINFCEMWASKTKDSDLFLLRLIEEILHQLIWRTYHYLEPEWPLVWLEKAFVWRGGWPSNIGSHFLVLYISGGALVILARIR